MTEGSAKQHSWFMEYQCAAAARQCLQFL